MSKIYEQPLLYKILKPYVIKALEEYFRPFVVVGREHIPKDGTVIFAPNHRNGLMDALSILSITPSAYSTTFMSRADIFKNKIVAGFLHFAKLMPAYRIRDGYENLNRNNESFEQSVELLQKGNALCIMPEGNQETEQRVRPLVKGVFRIAFATQDKIGQEKSVKIIPIGLDYGSIYTYGKHLIINIGKLINMADYMDLFRENQPQAINKLRKHLSASLKNSIIDIESNDYYEEVLMASKLAGIESLKTNKKSTIASFIQRREAVRTLSEKEKTDIDGFKTFAENCRIFTKNIHELHLKPEWISRETPSLKLIMLDAFLLLMTLPVFVQGLILNFIPFFLPYYLRKYIFKPEFDGFYSSIEFGFGLVIFPLYYLVQFILFLTISPIPWWLLGLLIPLQYLLGKWAFTWYHEFREYVGRVRYRYLRISNNKILEHSIRIKEDILKYIKN